MRTKPLARRLKRAILAADVHAIGTDFRRQIDMIIDDQQGPRAFAYFEQGDRLLAPQFGTG